MSNKGSILIIVLLMMSLVGTSIITTISLIKRSTQAERHYFHYQKAIARAESALNLAQDVFEEIPLIAIPLDKDALYRSPIPLEIQSPLDGKMSLIKTPQHIYGIALLPNTHAKAIIKRPYHWNPTTQTLTFTGWEKVN